MRLCKIRGSVKMATLTFPFSLSSEGFGPSFPLPRVCLGGQGGREGSFTRTVESREEKERDDLVVLLNVYERGEGRGGD